MRNSPAVQYDFITLFWDTWLFRAHCKLTSLVVKSILMLVVVYVFTNEQVDYEKKQLAGWMSLILK